jgi:hypothetical protein
MIAAAGFILAACTAPQTATLVKVNGQTRWAEHPITRLEIAECRKVDAKFGIENNCGIETITD